VQNFLPTPSQLIVYGIILLTAFPVHEFAHAWVADRFGDSTPRANGRLTLNPLAHLDLIGSLMMILVGFGYAKPVPINPYILQRHSRSATMLVSIAGPTSNLIMAIFASLFFRLGIISTDAIYTAPAGFLPNIGQILLIFIRINLLLMLFNMLPLFPLDGEKVLDYFLPPSAARVFESIRPYSTMILLVLVFVLPRLFGIDLLGTIIVPALNNLTRLLIGA
jgi:Zn-dependent protease